MGQTRIEMLRSLLERLILDTTDTYQASQSDRKRLHEFEWKKGGNDPSILGESEVICDAIVGLAQSYLDIGLQKLEINKTNDILRKRSIYYSSVLLEWLLKEGDEYSAFTSYLHSIEHLRMFLSEIVSTRGEE